MHLFDWLSDYLSGGDAEARRGVSDSGFTDNSFGSGIGVGEVDDMLNSSTGTTSDFDDFAVNPANGLAMVGGIGGIDAAGNLYGYDYIHDHLAHLDAGIGDTSIRDNLFESSGFENTPSGGEFNDW